MRFGRLCRRAGRLAVSWPAVIAVLVATVLGGGTVVALELVVEAPPELAGVAANVRSLAGADLAPVLALIGRADPGPAIRVVLAGEGSELARRAPSWVAGYAMPPLSTIVLFPTRVPSYPDSNLATLLVHEVAHVLIARAAADREVPRWFDEGLATVAAREWALEDRARTALALLGHRPLSAAEVDDQFAGDDAAVTRAYALSAAFVRFILRSYGAETAARILAEIAGGEPFGEAFRRAAGVKLADAEEAFFRREAFWGTWVPFLTSSTALWIGITALALLAIRYRRRRDAELRAAWALEDGGVAPQAAPEEPPPPADDPSTGDPRRFN